MHRISTIIVLTGYSNHLYSASHDGYIKMWDLKTLVCLRVLKSSFSRIWLALLHLPSLNSLIALTNDNTLHLINPSIIHSKHYYIMTLTFKKRIWKRLREFQYLQPIQVVHKSLLYLDTLPKLSLHRVVRYSLLMSSQRK